MSNSLGRRVLAILLLIAAMVAGFVRSSLDEFGGVPVAIFAHPSVAIGLLIQGAGILVLGLIIHLVVRKVRRIASESGSISRLVRNWALVFLAVHSVGIFLHYNNSKTKVTASSDPSRVDYVFDPELYIQQNGYKSKTTGDDGKTVFVTNHTLLKESEIESYIADVKGMKKSAELLEWCNFLLGPQRIQLSESSGSKVDGAVLNYGHDRNVIACSNKYIMQDSLGLPFKPAYQVIFSKKSEGHMYQVVFVTMFKLH